MSFFTNIRGDVTFQVERGRLYLFLRRSLAIQ